MAKTMSTTNAKPLPIISRQLIDAEIICPRMTMERIYFAASAAFSAMNLRFSLLSRTRTDDIVTDRQGQLFP